MKKFRGAITALVTPFKKNGDVDLDTLRKLVQFQLTNKIDGIVACGSTGEAATLNNEEYESVVRAIVDEVGGRVPVIAGAGSNDTQKAIELSLIAKNAGVDGLLHVTPYYNKPTLPGLIAHYKAITNMVDLPIILYNVPGRTGLNMTAQMTLAVVQKVEQVVGVKEASGNISQIIEIIKDKPRQFLVLSGDDALTLPILALGGDGCISVVSNEIPREFTRLIRSGIEQDFAKAKKLHFEFLDLMNINFIETNPIPVKTALSLMGKIDEYFRLPLVSMTQQNREILQSVLGNHQLIPTVVQRAKKENVFRQYR
jgi:4-hydroxy-tetrahydrodipicolinate synthase